MAPVGAVLLVVELGHLGFVLSTLVLLHLVFPFSFVSDSLLVPQLSLLVCSTPASPDVYRCSFVSFLGGMFEPLLPSGRVYSAGGR